MLGNLIMSCRMSGEQTFSTAGFTPQDLHCRHGARLVAQNWKQVLRNSVRQRKRIEHGFDPVKRRHALIRLPVPLEDCPAQ